VHTAGSTAPDMVRLLLLSVFNACTFDGDNRNEKTIMEATIVTSNNDDIEIILAWR
jgi:hypothetical protein